MQREEGDFDRKASEQCEQDPPLFAGGERGCEGGQVADREGPVARLLGVLPGDVGEAQQHEQRTHKGVDKELEGRFAPIRATVDRQHEEAGDQRRLEERVETNHIASDKDAHHAGREDQEPNVELASSFLDRNPRAQHTAGHQEDVQQDQKQGNAVDAEFERDTEARKHREGIGFRRGPVEPLLGLPVGELHREHHGPGEGGQRATERDRSGVAFAAETDADAGDQRKKKEDPELHQTLPRIQTQTIQAITSARPPAIEVAYP